MVKTVLVSKSKWRKNITAQNTLECRLSLTIIFQYKGEFFNFALIRKYEDQRKPVFSDPYSILHSPFDNIKKTITDQENDTQLAACVIIYTSKKTTS